MSKSPSGMDKSSSQDRTTTELILNSVPEIDRSRFLSSLVESLQPGDQSAINFVTALIERTNETGARETLICFIQERIRDGKLPQAVSIGQQYPQLGGVLLSRAVSVLGQAKSEHGTCPSDSILCSYLRFCQLLVSHLPLSNVRVHLLRAGLDLLQHDSPVVHLASKDLVLELCSLKDAGQQNDLRFLCQDTIWNSVRKLLASKHTTRIVTGYSIWLRLISAPSVAQFVGTITDDLDYWGIILHGLRCGDAERRKMCLNILKITVGADSDAVSNGLRKQYIRYATVFETIVLGRYINQVMECRNDLDFFANQEELDPRWVFTLLGAALDSQMQDSNRKFIGNWVMSANLKPGSQLVAFFEKDFLPWATQGQHFVATLKNENGHISCRHGQQLADFIKRLRRNSQDPKQITSIVVDAILRKRNSMFAYCTVYLLEGLEDSLDRQQTLDLARLRGLPEVARDYVALKTGGTPASEPDARTASVRHIRERKALDKIDSFESSLESLDDIWTDVEYLEFPKKLLMVLPAVILGPNTIAKAVNNAKLAGSISEKVETLQRVATTKTFLFPPLMMELRKAAKVIPEAYNVLDIPKLIVQIAEQLPGLTIDLMLEEAVIPLTPYSYEQYFGERLSYGFAAYIDLVSRLKEHQSKLKSVIDLILHPWKSQKIPPPIVTPWKNALQLQVLLLCFEQYKSHSTDEIYRILEDLFTVLAIEPLPSYRYLLEATVVRFIMLHKLRDTLIERLKTKDHHSNPKHLASLMKIGAILACTPDTTEQFAADLAIAFVSLAASSKVLIRHEAQWQVPVLVDHAKAQGWTSITTNPALSALDEYIRSLERFHDPPTVRQMSRFDPATDLTLTNLVEGRWFELDSTEQPLTSHNDFVKLYAQHSLRDAAPTCIPLGQPIARPLPETIKVHDEQPLTAPPGPKTLTDVTTALQTKGTAYLARALSTTPTSRRYPDLVVVASLVANPHNLGGLSRVSEVFGANALTLQNQNVLSNKEFLSVSVSSHLHFPIFQLSAPGMVAWLRERKRGGYTVVGIEQTDRSVMLGTKEARLPEKCCLVVGSEREGIPADVLVECELLVEIEQRGVTRSLNVQTAVGIVLFEYGRQHGGPK